MSTDIAVLGAGMHPWGKWGRDFVEYGLAAARAALADAGLSWPEIQYVAGADTIRNGYPGFIAGATFAQALGWSGARISSSYAACASGAQAFRCASMNRAASSAWPIRRHASPASACHGISAGVFRPQAVISSPQRRKSQKLNRRQREMRRMKPSGKWFRQQTHLFPKN